MSSPPPRGWHKLQAALLADVRAFDKEALKPTPEIRVTTLLGELKLESHDEVYVKVSAVPRLLLETFLRIQTNSHTPNLADFLFFVWLRVD